MSGGNFLKNTARLFILSMFVLLSGGLFITKVSAAPATITRPDFKITEATFDGRKLHVEYINATGIGYPARRYEVGFQWYDASGATLGGRRWIPVPEVERGGVSILDTKYNTALSYKGTDKRIYGETLPYFIAHRPDLATELRITVDDGDRIAEENEMNNVAAFTLPPLPKPDFIITAEGALASNTLTLIAQNIGNGTGPELLSYWFEWVNTAGGRVGPLYWYDARGVINQGQKVRLDITRATLRRDRPYDAYSEPATFSDLITYAPKDATHLKIRVDGPNTYAETNEENNVLLLPKPIPVQPDITIENATLDNDGLTYTQYNRGEGALHTTTELPISTWFDWLDDRGYRVGALHWLNVQYPFDPGVGLNMSKQNFTHASLVRETGGTVSGADFLASPPPGATRLQISADGPNAFSETNENNNRQLLKVLIPDLTLENATLTSAGLSYVTRNKGQGALRTVVNRPLSTWFDWLDDRGYRVGALHWLNVQYPFDPGIGLNMSAENFAQASLTRETGGTISGTEFLASPPNGATRLQISADGPNAFTESDETNNRVILVKPKAPTIPDLTIKKTDLQNNVLSIDINNIGNGPAGATDIWLMWFGTKGALSASGTVDLPALAADGTTTVMIPLDGKTEASQILREPPKDGTRVRIYLDGSRKIDESNENNNDAMFDRTKLLAVIPENKSPVADAGEGITERDDDGDGIEIVRFYSRESKDPDGKIVSWRWTLGGKEIATGQYPYWRSAPVGTHTVMLTVTDDHGLTATDTVIITVSPKPSSLSDLRVAELKLEPAAPKIGDVVEFIVRVENIGGVNAGAVSTTTLDVDLKNDGTFDELKARFTTKDLKPGESETHRWRKDYGRDYTWTAVAGTHAFMACANWGNYIKDSNNKNNCQRLIVTVGAPKPKDEQKLPDLSLREPVLSNASSYLYQIQTFNLGEIVAPPHTWDIQWVDADDKTVGPPFRSTFDQELLPGRSVGNPVQYKIGIAYTALDKYMVKPPDGAVRVRITVDPENLVKEIDETNNERYLAPPPAPEQTPPELTASLSVEVASTQARGNASPFATTGFMLAFGAFLSSGWMVHKHHRAPRTLKGILKVLRTALHFSPKKSYMRLRECRPQSCRGAHFAHHKTLHSLMHTSLVATIITGMAKIGILLAVAFLGGHIQSTRAAIQETIPGNALRATMVVKNIGAREATGITLSLPCPDGTQWKNAQLNNNEQKNTSDGIVAPNLSKDASHRLVVTCAVQEEAVAKKTLRFIGSAKIKDGERIFKSNMVEMSVRPKPEAPAKKADLAVSEIFLVSENIFETDDAPFTVSFAASVDNFGEGKATPTRARLRIDAGKRGTWNVIPPAFANIGSMDPETSVLAHLSATWPATVGSYRFEVCADADKVLKESNEDDNCSIYTFILAPGEGPLMGE